MGPDYSPGKGCSQQTALHTSSTSQPLPLSKVLGACQGKSFCRWSEMFGTCECCLPLHSILYVGLLCNLYFCPLLLRQQGGDNKSCLSMFIQRETWQKLASVCWRNGASREWWRVAFFRISVCSCSRTHMCMHNNVFNITLHLDTSLRFCWLI